MGIKLVAIDIDDTLLNPEGQLADETINAIKKTIQKGVKVVLCTGRPLAGVTSFLNQLGISGDDQYVITYNGAIIETVSGHRLAQHTLDFDDYLAADKLSYELNVHYNILDDESRIYTSNRDVGRITVIQAAENDEGLFVRNPEEMPQDLTVSKIMFVDEPEVLDAQIHQIKATFDDHYYVVRSLPEFLEVLNKKANKGNALTDLLTELGLKKEEVMAMGDQHNDLTMFAVAGTTVAMGNAIPELKEVATYVTESNANHGVAVALERYVI